MRGRVVRVSRAADFSHVVSYGLTSVLGAAAVASLLAGDSDAAARRAAGSLRRPRARTVTMGAAPADSLPVSRPHCQVAFKLVGW